MDKKEEILTFLKGKEKLSESEIAVSLRINAYRAKTILEELVKEKKILIEEKGSYKYYKLNLKRKKDD